MRRKMFSLIAVAAVTMLTLAGCGSNRDSSGSVTGDADDVLATAEVQGVANCLTCHSNSPQVAGWLASSAHGNSNEGPDFNYYGNDEQVCGVCHNANDDGDQLESVLVGEANRPIVSCESCHGGGEFHSGVGPIPYVRPDWQQCTACHDHAEGVTHSSSQGMLASSVGASAHNNADNLHASSAKCQRCHSAEGSVAFARYTGDKTVMDQMETDAVAAYDVEENMHPVTCAACHVPHTDTLRADTVIVNDNAITSGDWDPNGNGIADQFDFCTSCHTYYNQDGDLVGSGSTESGTAPFYHNTAWYRTLPSTHYDDPDTGYGLTANIQEGYVIRENSANPCFDCHGHELRTNTRRHLEDPALGADYGPTIHTDWANSRHGAELLKAKVAADTGSRNVATVDAVMAAGRADGEGHGWSWTHYNWDASFKADGTDTDTYPDKDRVDCQRCHTSTGLTNFLDDPAGYDPVKNDFSHLVGWIGDTTGTINDPATWVVTTSSPQNEMLYCWGCHSNPQTGVVNDPGALTLTYTNDAIASYPDSAASNVCIACHTGRETGDSIALDTDIDGDRSFLNSHYLTAGGILFAEGGYEYATMDYAFAAGDRHQNIGYGSGTLTGDANFDAISDNYTSGPCVTCHFNSSDVNGLDRSHTLSPFTESATEGLVLNAVCVECHTSRGVGDAANAWYGLDFEEADFVEGVVAPHKGRMLGAQLALQAVLASKGILTDFSAYPYFFADSGLPSGTAGNGILDPGEIDRTNGFTDWDSVAEDLGVGLSTDATGTGWKNVMGAAFNLNLVAHDPGATAHNRRYARRLLYDSIDFMDDGIMNDSTNATVTAQAQPYTASALSYIGSRP